MDTVARFVTPVIVFLLTLASGLWLSRSGKPLKTGYFHRTQADRLGRGRRHRAQTYNTLRNPVRSQPIVIALLIVIGLCVVALFVTGALMSAEKPGYPVY